MKIVILCVMMISVTACSSTLAKKQVVPTKVTTEARDRN